MEVHKPRPIHSLREFLKEVGIIVLGVIIALASDAASHTSADRMVTWSKPYRLMAVLEATNLTENSDRLQLQSTRRSGGSLSPAEQDRMLSAIVRLRDANHKIAQWSRVTLPGLSKNGIAVTPSVRARILQGFRERYGNCAVEPSLRGLNPNDQLAGMASQ